MDQGNRKMDKRLGSEDKIRAKKQRIKGKKTREMVQGQEGKAPGKGSRKQEKVKQQGRGKRLEG